jgi:thiamine biosynthesis lipoprotein
MRRRDFLHPKHVARQIFDVAKDWSVPTESPSEEAVVLRFGRRAMATTFEVLLPFGAPNATPAAESALDLVDQLEAQLTVYRDDSEVSRLNQQAAHAPVPVEEGLFDLLVQCQRLHQATGGAFDVAVGALVKCWGFYRRQGRVPTDEERDQALRRCGWSHVVLDAEAKTVAFDQSGVEINFGSIGKGYALDRVVRHLRRDWQVAAALVHGGHSSVFAMGSEPGRDNGWPVGLLHPEKTSRRLGVVQLKNRGMATSAATQQHFLHEGRNLGHILDPRTAWPAEGVLSATVTAPTAAEADALATAFYILGPEAARKYCAAHPDIGAVLLPAKGSLVVLGRAVEEFG